MFMSFSTTQKIKRGEKEIDRREKNYFVLYITAAG
jgi:hypothetical protein